MTLFVAVFTLEDEADMPEPDLAQRMKSRFCEGENSRTLLRRGVAAPLVTLERRRVRARASRRRTNFCPASSCSMSKTICTKSPAAHAIVQEITINLTIVSKENRSKKMKEKSHKMEQVAKETQRLLLANT
jgi:hypothetical protein